MAPNHDQFLIYKQFLSIFICIGIFFELTNQSSSTEVAERLPEDNICAKFTLQFLDEFSQDNPLPSSLFGWITTEGNFSLGQPPNGTHLTIQCLALALSDWDFLVDRACLMTLVPAEQHAWKERFVISPASSVHQQNDSNNFDEDDSTHKRGQSVSFVGPFNYDLDYLHLINFIQERPYKHPETPRPCIFPIDNQFASKMSWHGTVCGIKKTFDQRMDNTSGDNRPLKIICHPIDLSLENGKMRSDRRATFYRVYSQLLQKGSPLFLFDEPLPNNTYLRAVGTLDGAIRFFNEDDCERLETRSTDRVQCAVDDYSTSTYSYSPSTYSIRPFTREDANSAFLMAPLIVLSLLITSGMLITAISFIVQHKRQTAYNTIN